MKPHIVETYNSNLAGNCSEFTLELGDPPYEKGETADILMGGPPCQPFSQIGYQRGHRDLRDGFPIFLDAVNRLRPRLAIIENVRGLLFRNKDYLRATCKELERFGYVVDVRLIDTSIYGVPQKRQRVVVVASRTGWAWPEPVIDEPVTVGMALGELARQVTDESRFLTASMDHYIASYEAASKCITPRDLHLDQPSRTVTCRNLGAATSDMLRIRLKDGRRRMLHLREGARLMSFPDWFTFNGNPYEQAEQIGNAVAPLLSLALGREAMKALEAPLLKTPKNTAKHSLAIADPISEKKEQALALLGEAGLVLRELTPRGRERAALCLLALAHIEPQMSWQDAKSHVEDATVPALGTRKIIEFRNIHYNEGISSGSYDDVRRRDLELLASCGFVQARANKAHADTNDGTRGYALTAEAVALLRAFRTAGWDSMLQKFRDQKGIIRDRLAKARKFNLMKVNLPNGKTLDLDGGKHNEIQKAVIEQFLPRFSRGAHILYVGDASKKGLFVDDAGFERIGLARPSRGTRLPDIVAWEEERNWLFLIEAVHSSNPISEARHGILDKITAETTAGRIYVTAFLNRKVFAKWLGSHGIAWETEVWLADQPDHCTHFNGERFLGPYKEPHL